jgi:serine/threonine protein kinase
MREGRIAARLQHQNAVTVYDVAEDDDQPWLVMEYVPSRSLAAVLNEQGVLPPAQVAKIGTQVAAALAAAHAAGIVHRDVKPGNVLLTDDGVVKITDFGISRATDDVVLTATGLLSGTPAYLAPEVAQGDPPVPSSDVFALGATLYAAVEGQPPFGFGDNTLALLHTVAAGKVAPPQRAGALTPVLMRLLAVDPATRPDMAAASVELAAFGADQTRPAFTQVAVARPVPRPVASTPPVPRTAPQPTPPRPVVPARPAAAPVPPPNAPATRVARSAPATAAQRTNRVKLAVVLSVVAALVLVTAGVLVVRGIRNHRAELAQTGPVTSTSQAASPTSEVSAPGSAKRTKPDTPAVVTYESSRQLVLDYYALLPNQPEQAFRMLTPEFQKQSGGLAKYEAFYNTIAAITVTRVTPVGSGTVTAVLNFTKVSGGTTHERYQFTVVSTGSSLLIAAGNRTGSA